MFVTYSAVFCFITFPVVHGLYGKVIKKQELTHVRLQYIQYVRHYEFCIHVYMALYAKSQVRLCNISPGGDMYTFP